MYLDLMDVRGLVNLLKQCEKYYMYLLMSIFLQSLKLVCGGKKKKKKSSMALKPLISKYLLVLKCLCLFGLHLVSISISVCLSPSAPLQLLMSSRANKSLFKKKRERERIVASTYLCVIYVFVILMCFMYASVYIH